jgi:hypothetical protein
MAGEGAEGGAGVASGTGVGEEGVAVGASDGAGGVAGDLPAFSTLADVDGDEVVSDSFFEQPTAISTPEASVIVKMNFKRCMLVLLLTLHGSAYSPRCGSVQSPFRIILSAAILDSNTAVARQYRR